jgi:hypothetical protein
VKSATLIRTLTSLTTAMAVAAPIVVFGFLYVLRVQPERAAAAESRRELAAARAELSRRRAFVTSTPEVTAVPTLNTFDARTTEANRVGDVTDALSALLNSPAVGRVSNLSIETGVAAKPPIDSMARLFSPTVVYTPVTVMFDARYEQIGRFFWNLRVLPTTFDLRSVEITPVIASRGGVMRARVSLFVFHRPETAALPAPAPRARTVDVVTAPDWTRDPFAMRSRPDADRPVAAAQPALVVSSILYSSGRRLAIVDGQIVRAGDRVRSGVVRSIEPDAVVIVEASGVERRVALQRPVIRMVKR